MKANYTRVYQGVKVKFYEGNGPMGHGLYTITDEKGEHEVGIYYKEQLIMNNGKVSRDKRQYVIITREFGSQREIYEYSIREMAERLAYSWRQLHK